MKKLTTTLTLLMALIYSDQSFADFQLGLLYGKSEPKNYELCECPPDFNMQNIEATIEATSFTALVAYQLESGFFFEGRYVMESERAESKVLTESNFETRGLDVKLNSISNLSAGYTVAITENLRPYIMVGNTFNISVDTYLPDGPFYENESYSNMLSYGIGANWNITNSIALKLDFQKYSSAKFGDEGKVDVSFLSAGLSYNF